MTIDDLSTAAAALGRKGGLSTSEKKRAASRENGKRGGRPRKSQGEIKMARHTIYRSDYKSQSEYSKDYQSLCDRYDYKVKVDDGKGGTGWMFFESKQDYDLWKRTK